MAGRDMAGHDMAGHGIGSVFDRGLEVADHDTDMDFARGRGRDSKAVGPSLSHIVFALRVLLFGICDAGRGRSHHRPGYRV